MSVSGQVSATGPPHRRTRGPKRRAPALNSTDARPCDRPPRGTAPLAAPAGFPSHGGRVRRPLRGTAAAQDAGSRRAGGPGARVCGERGSWLSCRFLFSPFRAVPGIAPKTAVDEECNASRVVRHRRGHGARPRNGGSRNFSAPSERTPERPFRRRWRRKRAVFGHRPPDVQETTFPNPECTSRVSIPTKKRGCAQRGRDRAAPPPRTVRSPVPRPRSAPYPAASRPPCISDRMMWLSR